jgi:thioredoxin-related protein
MKTALLAGCLALVTALSTLAADSAASPWKTDLPAAKTEARKDKKVILMDFTGSDWCGWCIKMKKDTLDQKAFLDYAAKSLVLVEVDFPNRKSQPADLKKANKALQDKYGVQGFPTYVLVDADGKELGRQVGYLQGGPTAFIDQIEAWKKSPAK